VTDVAQVKAIELDDDESVEFITVKLTVAEAAFIAAFTGKQTGETANEVMSKGGAEASSGLYDAFTGGVFNRWYDGGVNEWYHDHS
jgi:hypothetical protein